MRDAFKELGDAIVRGFDQTDSENENKPIDWYMQELREEIERLKGKAEAYEFLIERMFANGKE